MSASSSSRRSRARRRSPFAFAVALGERAVADPAQHRDRRLGAVREVGVAVPELVRQVERAPRGDLGGARDGVAVVREPLRELGRREEDALVVPAPLRLAPLERRVAADRHEHVLQEGAAARVRVGVAGRDRRHAERRRQVAQRRVPAHVAALVGPLQLDVEAVRGRPERARPRDSRFARRRRVGRSRRARSGPRSARRGRRGRGRGLRAAATRVPAAASPRAPRSRAGRGSRTRAGTRRARSRATRRAASAPHP